MGGSLSEATRRFRSGVSSGGTSLDEMPQLFNVLFGDMSLVGQRPLPTEDMEADGMSRQYAEWAETRALALPGITGLCHRLPRVDGQGNAEGITPLFGRMPTGWQARLGRCGTRGILECLTPVAG